MAGKYYWDGIDIASMMSGGTRNIVDGNQNTLFNDFPGNFGTTKTYSSYTSNEARPNFKVGSTFIIEGQHVHSNHYTSSQEVSIPVWANAIKTYMTLGRGQQGINKVLYSRHQNNESRRARNNTQRHENFSTVTNYGGLGSPAKYYYISKVISIPLNGTIDLTISNTGNTEVKIEVKNASSTVVAKIEMTGLKGTNQTVTPYTRNIPDRRNNDTRDTNTNHRVVSDGYRARTPAGKNLTTVRTRTNGLPSTGTATDAHDNPNATSAIWIYWFYQPPS